MKQNKTLHLNLKRKWFDMILSGEKKEEYRDWKPYWESRFGKADYCTESYREDGIWYGPLNEFDTITFRNGYKSDAPEFEIELNAIRIKYGKTEWGAEENEKYFVLELGEILNTGDVYNV